MDLYVRIAVILAILITAAGIIYLVDGSISITTKESGKNIQELQGSMNSADNLFFDKYNLTTPLSGDMVWDLLNQADSKRYFVMMATMPQQGLIVNYGYQLRGREHDGFELENPATITGNLTQFEKYYVTTNKVVFYPRELASYNGSPLTRQNTTMFNNTNLADRLHMITTGIKQFNANDDFLPGGDNQREPSEGDPHLYLEMPGAPINMYSKTGLLADRSFITDQYVNFSQPPNMNLSFAKSATSPYFVNPEAEYYVAPVKTPAGAIVGFYVEENGLLKSKAIIANLRNQLGLNIND